MLPDVFIVSYEIAKRIREITRGSVMGRYFFNAVGNFSNKNVNVTIIMFLMSGDLTGLCLYIFLLILFCAYEQHS